MHLRFCSCRQCKYGRDSSFGQAIIKRAKRHGRQQVRLYLRTGEYDRIPRRASVPYTD